MPPDPPRGYRLQRAFIRTPLHEICPSKYLLKMLEMAFQNFLGGGGAYYFLSAIHFKTY